MVPREVICAPGRVGGQVCHWAGPYRGTRIGRRLLLGGRGEGSPFLPSGPSRHGHHGKVRGAPAQSGLWEALAPLEALPREVRAETEGLEAAVLWEGQPEVSLFLLSHGSVR